MIARLAEGAGDWIALALMAGVAVAALGAATARSLYAMVMFLAAAGALTAAALLAQGAGDAALAQALAGAGAAPVLLLATLLLSARAAKQRRRLRPWLTIAAGSAAAGVILWTLPDLGVASPVRVALTGEAAFSAWLAPLLLVAAAACCGMLGFGERGPLEPAQAARRE